MPSIERDDILYEDSRGDISIPYGCPFCYKAGCADEFILNKAKGMNIFMKEDPGTLISIETDNYHIKGKKGNWLAIDSIVVEGREFFLMEHKEYGTNAAYAVLDAGGAVVAEDNHNGFDEDAKQQIRRWLHSPETIQTAGGWKKADRTSVLAKLHQKQAEIEKNSRGTLPQIKSPEDIENRQK